MKATHWSILACAVLAAVVAGCGGDDDKNPMNPGGGTPDVTINILGDNGTSSYNPSPDTVTVGKTVAWHNSNGTTHTATVTDADRIVAASCWDLTARLLPGPRMM